MGALAAMVKITMPVVLVAVLEDIVVMAATEHTVTTILVVLADPAAVAEAEHQVVEEPEAAAELEF
tara:strand:- start:173 stop:370 length:198 start_codon:yes stop_codon:yes gene_type:complete